MADGGLIEGLKPGSAAFYRRRFESSVMGQHMMMPPAEVALQMVHPEAPPTHPKGPNTNFQYPTPIPFRYRDEALGSINKRHEPSEAKTEHPIYASTTMEIGKLPMQPTDFPMRWYKKTASAPARLSPCSFSPLTRLSLLHPLHRYGLEGMFTEQWASALPKTRVATGLNTAMDRSKHHHEFDQGWRGNLGLTDCKRARPINAASRRAIAYGVALEADACDVCVCSRVRSQHCQPRIFHTCGQADA